MGHNKDDYSMANEGRFSLPVFKIKGSELKALGRSVGVGWSLKLLGRTGENKYWKVQSPSQLNKNNHFSHLKTPNSNFFYTNALCYNAFQINSLQIISGWQKPGSSLRQPA